MTRAEQDIAERKLSRALQDMRLVYEDMVGTDGSTPTKSQKVLHKLFEDSPDKFMARMEKLQLEHDKKITAIEERLAAQIAQTAMAQQGQSADCPDEGHEKVEDLLDELLASFDPVAEAKRYVAERQARPLKP
jgi:hypothetical protein